MNTTESFFNALKSHRESKDIKLEDISDATRINPKYFEAIESGDFTVLPTVYMRLFLRTYTEYIGADSAKALEDFELHTTGQVSKKKDEPRPLVVETSNEDSDEFELGSDFQITPQKIATAIGAILLIFLFFKLVEAVTTEQEANTPQIQPVEIEEKGEIVEEPIAEEPAIQYSVLPNTNLLTENNFLNENLLNSSDTSLKLFAPYKVEIESLTETKINLSHGNDDNLRTLFNGVVQADTTLSFQFDTVLYFDLWSGQHLNMKINDNLIENLTDNNTVRGSYDSNNSQLSLKFYKH